MTVLAALIGILGLLTIGLLVLVIESEARANRHDGNVDDEWYWKW